MHSLIFWLIDSIIPVDKFNRLERVFLEIDSDRIIYETLSRRGYLFPIFASLFIASQD